MAKNYICAGKLIELVAVAAITSGQVLKVGALIVVAANSASIGEKVVGERSGVFTTPKKAADNIGQGVAVYWDDTAKEMTLTEENNTLAGHAYEAAEATKTELKVILLG